MNFTPSPSAKTPCVSVHSMAQVRMRGMSATATSLGGRPPGDGNARTKRPRSVAVPMRPPVGTAGVNNAFSASAPLERLCR